MRDVRSKSYFEQMKGRGTRVLDKDDLQRVTPDAAENKSRFIIVDAVGVTTSKKSDTRPLERKPSVSLNELMKFVSYYPAECTDEQFRAQGIYRKGGNDAIKGSG